MDQLPALQLGEKQAFQPINTNQNKPLIPAIAEPLRQRKGGAAEPRHTLPRIDPARRPRGTKAHSARPACPREFSSTSLQTMLGFSGLLLSLGGLYWLISDGDRRLFSAASSASPDTAGADQSRVDHFK